MAETIETVETESVPVADTSVTETAESTKKTRKKTAAKAAAENTEATETPGTASPAGIVKILYIDTVMNGNQIPIGHGAMITGSGRIFTKTLEEFEGEFMTRFVQRLIRARKFIILSGLTDEQREMYGCKYSDGEVLQNAGLFSYLLNCGTAKAVEIYTSLCKEHREMVCTYLISRKEAGDGRVTIDLLRALDDISRGDYADGKSPLAQLLKT